MNFAHWNAYLLFGGFIGWTCFLVIATVRRGLAFALAMGALWIVLVGDLLFFAPSSYDESGDALIVTCLHWFLGLSPWLALAWWLFHPLKGKLQSASES